MLNPSLCEEILTDSFSFRTASEFGGSPHQLIHPELLPDPEVPHPPEGLPQQGLPLQLPVIQSGVRAQTDLLPPQCHIPQCPHQLPLHFQLRHSLRNRRKGFKKYLIIDFQKSEVILTPGDIWHDGVSGTECELDGGQRNGASRRNQRPRVVPTSISLHDWSVDYPIRVDFISFSFHIR